ncbi:MAG TPA: CocE/NonD family hydrolase [Solirubrobacterales bacterium]|nr:CocE/NonD family hydrolase [Solirubrobacterales bacterium]
MFTRTWSTSAREYDVAVDRDVTVKMADGVQLSGDIYRPVGPGPFPVILGVSPYNKHLQSGPMKPIGFTPKRGYMESGDPNYFVRRGYVHAYFNVRGTGYSEGFFQFNGPREVEDIVELIAWLAGQEWSDGNVGMFGVSYFAKLAKAVATLGAPELKAIFAPHSANDWYRHVWYHGGILTARFISHWRYSAHRLRYRSILRDQLGDDEFEEALAAARQDDELMVVPALREALMDPGPDANALLVDILLRPLDGPWWTERYVDGEPGQVPAYLGSCWGNYALHLPGAFDAWRAWRGPKKLMIGPGVYLDRPLYQLQGEAVRWFDHWLKGVDTGVMDEPPIRCFIPPQGEWRALEDWPAPEARWMEFYLHEKGILSEREHWPNEGFDNFDESAFEHGELVYETPPLVEPTELLGPSVLTLYISSTEPEAFIHAALLVIDSAGNERELTRGWLRASQRKVDEEASTPWEPVLAHTDREPLIPGEIYEVKIPIVPTARLIGAGERIALRIKGADDEPAEGALGGLARDHLNVARPVRVTVYRNDEYPSRLDLPITRGNIIGTFFSGGETEFAVQTESQR